MSKGLHLVTGAGGFIGGHLVKRLLDDGYEVVAADIKPIFDWDQAHYTYYNFAEVDLRDRNDCAGLFDTLSIVPGDVTRVYNLAADMGGMGFIENNKALCMLSVLINTHMLMAAGENQVERYFFSSSACAYAADKQTDADVTALKEEDAYPASPEDGYGWEKLFSERMCRHFSEDFGLETRVARFHNVYGPNGTFEGGREKAPAAICRKVAEAVLSGEDTIGIWGDGEQTRSFMYVDDCVEGIRHITESAIIDPINLGSSELVSINQLVSLVEGIAGVQLKREYDLDAPKGVRGRNSDNSLILAELGWEPSTRLVDGLEVLYGWVYDQIKSRY